MDEIREDKMGWNGMVIDARVGTRKRKRERERGSRNQVKRVERRESESKNNNDQSHRIRLIVSNRL